MRTAVLSGRNVRIVAAASAVALTLGLAPAVSNPIAQLAPAAHAQAAAANILTGAKIDPLAKTIDLGTITLEKGKEATGTIALPAGAQVAQNLTFDGLNAVVSTNGVFGVTVANPQPKADNSPYTIGGTITISGLTGVASAYNGTYAVSGAVNVSGQPVDPSAQVEAFVAAEKCVWAGGSGYAELTLSGTAPTVTATQGTGGNFPGTLTYTNDTAANKVRVDWAVPAGTAPGNYTAVTDLVVNGKASTVDTTIKVVETQADCANNGGVGGSIGDLLGGIDLGSIGGTNGTGSVDKLTGSLSGANGTGSVDKLTGSLSGANGDVNLGAILLPLGLLALGGLAIGAMVNAGPAGSIALPFPLPGFPMPAPAPQPQPAPAPAPGPGIDNGRG